MTVPERPHPPRTGAESETLLGFLEYCRSTLRIKASGLTSAQLATTLPPSSMTLGGMIKHLAYVEDWWFSCIFAGQDPTPPFDQAPWDSDDDWEWHSAASDSPAELFALWERTLDTSRRITDAALSAGSGMDQLSASRDRHGTTPALRWVVTHMIEEYARHAGQADLIRESIDGQVGA